jgi:transcriptional regulator with XRE-family HTH domain
MPRKPREIPIGRRLAAARLRRGLSQGSVARRAGLAPSYLSRIETGKIQPTFATVTRITGALRVSLHEIGGPMQQAQGDGGPCPLTTAGRCMVDLIRSEPEVERGLAEEAFTPRQVRLLRRLIVWMHGAGSEKLRAMEIILEEMTKGAG